MSASLASPIAVKPTNSALYCIGTITRYSATTASTSFPVSVTIGAYVVSGVYSGVGLPTSTPSNETPKLQVNR